MAGTPAAAYAIAAASGALYAAQPGQVIQPVTLAEVNIFTDFFTYLKIFFAIYLIFILILS